MLAPVPYGCGGHTRKARLRTPVRQSSRLGLTARIERVAWCGDGIVLIITEGTGSYREVRLLREQAALTLLYGVVTCAARSKHFSFKCA